MRLLRPYYSARYQRWYLYQFQDLFVPSTFAYLFVPSTLAYLFVPSTLAYLKHASN